MCTVHVVGFVNMHCYCMFYRASGGWANARDAGKNTRPAPLIPTTVQGDPEYPGFLGSCDYDFSRMTALLLNDAFGSMSTVSVMT
jgi:hypothetical protein